MHFVRHKLFLSEVNFRNGRIGSCHFSLEICVLVGTGESFGLNGIIVIEGQLAFL